MDKLIICGEDRVIEEFVKFFSNNGIDYKEIETGRNDDDELFQCDPATIAAIIKVGTFLIGTGGVIPFIITLFKPHGKKCKIKIEEENKTTKISFSRMDGEEIAKILEKFDKHEK